MAPTSRRGVVVALACVATLGTLPAGAAADRSATVLDPVSPIDAAAFGEWLVWLRPVGERDAGRSLLVVRDDPSRPPRVIDVAVPKRTSRVTLGVDGEQRATIVLATARGLYRVAMQGSPRLRRVPGTTAGDSAPALRAGGLAFTRPERINGRPRTTVRLGSLSSRRSQLLWAGAPGTTVSDTALGAADSVVFVTDRPRAGAGSDLYARVIRPGGFSRKLVRQINGEGAGASGFGRSTISADGRRVSIVRWDESGGHANDVTVFSLPAGRQLARTRQPDPPGESTFLLDVLPLASGESAGIADLDAGLHLLP